jgi:hypothetical protein
VAAALVDDGVEFFLGPHFLGTIDLVTMSAKGPFRNAVVESARLHRFRTESAWLEALVARGVDRRRAGEALWLCFSVLRGMAVRRFIDDDAAERRRRLKSLRDLLTDQLGLSPRKTSS